MARPKLSATSGEKIAKKLAIITVFKQKKVDGR